MKQTDCNCIIKTITRFEEYFLSAVLLQVGLSIFFQVIMRYVFHSAVTWLDELVRYEVIFITFFGAGLGIKYGSHISVGALKEAAKKPWKNILEAFNHLVVAGYAMIVIYYGNALIKLMARHPHFSPTLRIPKHYLYAMVCVGMGLICIRSLIVAGTQVYRIFKSDDADSNDTDPKDAGPGHACSADSGEVIS